MRDFEVEEGYRVELPPGNHLIVVAGAHMGEPAYDFDHPNIVAKKSELFEFKHYRKSGSKFWTSKAGISFYLVIPKAQIELLPEKGYSYVPVLIQGRKCFLNVSGGGGGINSGWTDYVARVAHIGCGWTIRRPFASLAGIAVSPFECQAPGDHPGDRAAQGLPTSGSCRGGCRRHDADPAGTGQPSALARWLGLPGQPGAVCRRIPAAAETVFPLQKRTLVSSRPVRGDRLDQNGRDQRRDRAQPGPA